MVGVECASRRVNKGVSLASVSEHRGRDDE